MRDAEAVEHIIGMGVRVAAEARLAFKEKYVVLTAEIIGRGKSRNSRSDDGYLAHDVVRILNPYCPRM